jgi:Kef-type K+ transport system membrane component KefB/Trk K+ transport system NAD-binding subunit
MEEAPSFISLLLVLFLAFLVPIVLLRFKNLRLPIVVGEILAGILVGGSGLGLVRASDPVLEVLSQLGFVFLMFLSGMEIDFSGLRITDSKSKKEGQWTRGPILLSVLNFALTLVLSSAFGLFFAKFGLVRNAWMLALILSTTSLGVVMPVLKEGGLIRGPVGQLILVAAMIADFATMLLITVLVAVLSSGLTLDILLIGVLFVVFFLMYYFGRLFFDHIPGVRRVIEELSHASAQLKVRAAFTLMLIFVALSEALGTELILGAFLAGAVVSLLRIPSDAALSQKLEGIGFGFFIPIFFIMVGVNFSLAALFESPQAILLVPLLLAAAIIVKFIPALVFRLRFSWRESLAAGSLLSARLSLIIAASAIGVRLGVISQSVNAAIILVAIVTVTLAPLAFTRLIPKPVNAAPPIIVASTGELGLLVAEHLQAHGEPVIVIGSSDEGAAHARQRGIEVVLARLDQFDPVAAPYLEKARALICTSTDMEFNYQVCKLAHANYGIDHLVVQVNDPRDRTRFEQLGVLTLNPALDRIAMLALVGRNPALYELLTRTDDEKNVVEVFMRNPIFTNRPLKDIRLPGDLLVLAVHRQGELLVPHGNTILELGDQLTLVGSVEAIDSTRQMLAAPN